MTYLSKGLVSAGLHLLALLLIGNWVQGCRKSMPGAPGGEVFRDVGLFVVQGDETADGSEPDTESGNTANASRQALPDERHSATEPDQSAVHSVLPDEAPELSELLSNTDRSDDSSAGKPTPDSEVPSVIGPGAPLSSVPGGGRTRPLIPSSRSGQRAVGTGVPGRGQTAFMEIVDAGQSFVYLVDASSSMAEGNRLARAAGQLKASLDLLQPDQQFQVIFYSDAPERINMRPQPERPMYFATESNKLIARRQIDRAVPLNGTEHELALADALSLRPDVIYFLTDGDTPPLYADDLQQLSRISGRTTIHVVEFTSGGLTSRSVSWLEQLAQKFHGEYRRIETPGK